MAKKQLQPGNNRNQFGQGLASVYACPRGLARRALAIREKPLGPGHPDVAESLSYLAAGMAGRS